FSIYSIAAGVSIKILSVPMPGAILGLMVAYLGLRYFMMVQKLRKDLSDPSAVFSWSNFKFRKRVKNR
ncbi:MAG TPA: hypothetical protein VHR86_02575, partial [Armatimonadota bacterium]|nr:hypothetical protein [Armatimonadota bacterium]